MENLLRHPELYRIGADYTATYQVFPVEFSGKKYVVKKPRFLLSSLAHRYYTFQDQFFLRTRTVTTALDGLELEAQKLELLQGRGAPQLVEYRERVLVREYLEGPSFRELAFDSQQQRTLDEALATLQEIHGQGITVGDAHVKNIVQTDGKAYWVDFCPADESNLSCSQAADILKFIYSTYTVTRNPALTLYVARAVHQHCTERPVQEWIKALAFHLPSTPFSLWFSNRIPLKSTLPAQIERILSS